VRGVDVGCWRCGYRGWDVEACVPESELERQYPPSEMSLTYSTVWGSLSGGIA